MDRLLDETWRELGKEDRDVLVVLALDGPDTGANIHRKIRGDDVRVASSEGTTHRALARLRERGLTERGPGEDGRECINRLTSEGLAALQRGLIDPARAIGGATGEENR